ncbi:hypothetical protein BKA61DRAFT_662197 [Leptodontidium sp. MPI-SDFR-AT-0119]|nr:hypothetical protein BKA61DRAFT_662197 [Leptodontidium sp. MPI-SDFR-AT-0119]
MLPPSADSLSGGQPPSARRNQPPLLSETRDCSVSTDVVAQTLPAFPGFRKLPLELRLKIWNMAIPCRLITITPELDPENFTGEVEIQTESITIRGVCQESRREASRGYETVSFSDENFSSMYIDWSRDTIFLDLPEECIDIDEVVSVLGTAFRSVQTLAVRMRAHCFWGLATFLKQSNELQKLIFVDEPEHPPFLHIGNASMYLVDLGTWGFIKGNLVNFSESHQFFEEGTWIKLGESSELKPVGVRQWEMSIENISLVRRLIERGEKYFLLLPLT